MAAATTVEMRAPLAATLAALACLLAALTLGACGSASSSTSSTATGAAAATAPAAPGGTTAAKGGTSAGAGASASRPSVSRTAAATQFKQALASFTVCLSHNGVKLPAAGTYHGAPALNLKGVDTNSPSYRRAVARCRGTLTAALGSLAHSHTAPAASTPARSPAPAPKVKLPPALAAGLKGFTACMRSHGIGAFPEPTGASFNLTGTGVDSSSSQYKAAQTTCNPILQKAFSQR